jgi:hypothetical protein
MSFVSPKSKLDRDVVTIFVVTNVILYLGKLQQLCIAMLKNFCNSGIILRERILI